MTKMFFTPKEVAEELAPAIHEYTIIRMARAKEIEHSRGSRKAILFTRSQINKLVESMARPAEVKPPQPALAAIVEETPNYFGATDRSHRRNQRSQQVSA